MPKLEALLDWCTLQTPADIPKNLNLKLDRTPGNSPESNSLHNTETVRHQTTLHRQDLYQDREMTTRPLSRQRDGVNSPARNKYLWEKQKPFQTHTLARTPHALMESLQPQKTHEKYNKTPGWSKHGSIAIQTKLFEAQNRAQYLSKRFETRIKIEKELQSRTNLDSQNTPQLMKERIQR